MLAEALPWLERFHGATVVLKYGGNAMIDDALGARSPRTSCSCAWPVCARSCVHGGGPQITAMLDRLGVRGEFRGGYRVTTPEAMDVVRMVLTGQVQREVVGPASTRTARTPSACPARTRTCSPPSARDVLVDGEPVDIGLVGDVVDVRPDFVHAAARRRARSRSCPSVARGDDGEVYNVNADTAAAALAVALGAEKLVVLTDVEGLYADWPASDEVDPHASPSTDLEALLPTLASGMVPKMEACLRAVRGRRAARARARRPAAARACCSRSSPTRASARWCVPDDAPLFADEQAAT